ncbi:MAG: hypothetical protein R2716_08300 [Microthrixaceae bacterium]
MFRDSDTVELTLAQHQAPDPRPDLVGPLLEQLPAQCVLDGELVVPAGDGLDFDLLGQRIHPAESRVQKLAAETPAHMVLFDILALDDEDLRPSGAGTAPDDPQSRCSEGAVAAAA